MSTSTYAFNSLLMIELVKQIKENDVRARVKAWAAEIERKYGVELINEPCIDLSKDEITWADNYLELIEGITGLNLIQTFPRPEVDPHLALVKEFLKTVPVGEYQEARVEDGMMEDQMLWEAFCQNSGETVSFQDWHSIHHAYRRMGERVKLEIMKVERRVECDILALSREWMQKLSTVLAKSNSSEIVASYS